MTATRANPRDETLVVGLGETGLSVARHLAARGRRFAVTDTRDAPAGLERLGRIVPGVSPWVGPLASIDPGVWPEIVVSPGIPLSLPALADAAARGAQVYGDIDLFVRAAGRPLICITGSNGKSTVTALAGELMRALGFQVGVGGNLGPPALDLLDAGADIYVLELSSFQLEATRELGAASAAILNISPDHLDRHPGMEAYIAAKRRILNGARHVLLGREDPVLAPMAEAASAVTFGLGPPPGHADFGIVDVAGSPWLARGELGLLPAADLALRGSHNWLNALAALALVWPWVDRPEPLLDVLRGFAGLAHRCQLVGRRAGVNFVDDSKGTNVGATLAAIRGVEGPLVLIAGGQGKGQDFAPLADALVGKARGVVLIGVDAPKLARVLNGALPLRTVDSMEEAVAAAAEWAQAGDTVLLSPACASLDMFSDYADRGDRFAAAVRSLSP